MPSAFPTQQANGIIDGTKGSLGFVDVDRLPEEGVKPFIIVFPITHIPGAVQQNFHFKEQPNITIRNIRGKEHLFTLDNCGFEAKIWKFDKEWLTDEDTVQEKYLPAAEAFMKESLNCAKVVVFDWLVRPYIHSCIRTQFCEDFLAKCLARCARILLYLKTEDSKNS